MAYDMIDSSQSTTDLPDLNDDNYELSSVLHQCLSLIRMHSLGRSINKLQNGVIPLIVKSKVYVSREFYCEHT